MTDTERIAQLEATVAKQSEQIDALLRMMQSTADIFSDLQIIEDGEGHNSLGLYCDPDSIYEELEAINNDN